MKSPFVRVHQATPEILQEIQKKHPYDLQPLAARQYEKTLDPFDSGLVQGLVTLGECLAENPLKDVVYAESRNLLSVVPYVYIFHGTPDTVLELLRKIQDGLCSIYLKTLSYRV